MGRPRAPSREFRSGQDCGVRWEHSNCQQVSHGGVYCPYREGAVAGGVPSEPTLSPAWCWEDFLLTWENVDVLVPIHVRR